MSELREQLANIVRSRLEGAGMSQADAAAHVGLSQKHLSQILAGRQNGSLAMWDRLLAFVNGSLPLCEQDTADLGQLITANQYAEMAEWRDDWRARATRAEEERDRLRALRDQWQTVINAPDVDTRAQIIAHQYHESECGYRVQAEKAEAALAAVEAIIDAQPVGAPVAPLCGTLRAAIARPETVDERIDKLHGPGAAAAIDAAFADGSIFGEENA